MRPIRRRDRLDERRLAALLESERPQPSDDLVRRLAAELHSPRGRGLLTHRLVLASVVSIVALVALGSIGGIGSAFAAAGKAASSVVKTASNSSNSNSSSSSNSKIKICHATGSLTNPYVEIEVSTSGLNGHGGHTGDIIPAPTGGCPGGKTPGEDQYKPGKGSGDKNQVHFKEGKCKEKKDKKK